MNINELLGKHPCSCGRTHACAIAQVHIERGAVSHLKELCENFETVAVAADRNTYAACGEQVCSVLGEKLCSTKIFQPKGLLVPDETSAAELFQSASGAGLIVGVGSGVIQDLCKYVSFKMGVPYIIVATAPSMDGYASTGAAMIMNRMKVTYPCHVPMAILADTEVLKNAPLELIQSGFGDILGKYSCLCDWQLSHVVTDEYFCGEIFDLTMSMVKQTEFLAKKLLARDEESVKTLMEALVVVGIAMSYAESSRPASGSEHHLSHFFEIVGLIFGEPYFLHGIDVAYSAYVTQCLREKMIENGIPKVFPKFCRSKWEKGVKQIYKQAAEGVLELQNGLGWHEKSLEKIYREKEKEITSVLQSAPKSDIILAQLKNVGLDLDAFVKQYGKEKILNAVWYAKDLKDRYSVLWLFGAVSPAAPYSQPQ